MRKGDFRYLIEYKRAIAKKMHDMREDGVLWHEIADELNEAGSEPLIADTWSPNLAMMFYKRHYKKF